MPAKRKAKCKTKARAGRVAGGEWGVVYKKSGRRVPMSSAYGLGSRAKGKAAAAAKKHNSRC